MRVIKAREHINKEMLFASVLLATLPVIGLLSGEAISMGIYGANYQEVSLQGNPSEYWFIIKLELIVVFFFLIKAKFCFPLFDAAYQNVLRFKRENTFIAYTLLYLVIPVSVVALCLFLIWCF